MSSIYRYKTILIGEDNFAQIQLNDYPFLDGTVYKVYSGEFPLHFYYSFEIIMELMFTDVTKSIDKNCVQKLIQN